MDFVEMVVWVEFLDEFLVINDASISPPFLASVRPVTVTI